MRSQSSQPRSAGAARYHYSIPGCILYLARLRRSARLVHYGLWGRSLLDYVLSAEAGHLPKIPSRDVKVPHGDFGWVARYFVIVGHSASVGDTT